MTNTPSPITRAPTSAPASDTLRPNIDFDCDQVVCPGCGEQYVHFSLGHFESTDGYTCPLGTRGSWLALDMYCEHCPTTWHLVIGEHKGFTLIGNVKRGGNAA